ncbi:hypothetical protein VPH35_090939 [Triticum aestivum]
MLVPVHGDGIVAEGLLPGEPRLASVSTRSHANKIGTPPRPRHIPYSGARMVKHVSLILPHTALADLNACLLMCVCGCCWLLLLCMSAWCAPAVLCSHHHIHDK